MENLQPKLRFPEFREDWKLFKINDVGLVITGTTPSTSVKEYYNGSNLFLSPADIDDNRFVYNTKTTLSDLGFSKTRKLKPNSIAFVCIGSTIGKIAQVKKEFSTNQQINSIEFKNDFNEDFSYYTLLKESSKIKLMAGVQTVPQINKTEFSKIKISYPTLQEQTKIADFLGAVDKQLDILNQKKEKLNLYKKGTMQQLFAQQIRFKDDNGNDFPDWEEKRLLDFENLIHGDGDWILAKDIDSEGNINVIQLGNIGKGNFIDKDYKKITIETFNEIKGTPIKKGDLLINRMLNNYKLHSCLFPYNGDYITSVDVCWIRENIYFNNYFLKSLFSWEKSQEIFVSLSSGSGRIRISKKNLFERFVFKLPSIEEQTKIANFLSAIDTQIEAVENQITKTETYKKGLLQQMFV
ncbi:restriction endonuclease subunit S [Myroides sp. DF42-4-2]|uniref:restriction endonuclease subunit S n=1 Tax=Myroides sp. DF42-4-2 TaxID=2746726 RepID=UPI0025772BE5|nr:restriction endonuclease subunit S [Myroides sp. DF42-4-2]MDM1407443.1 restriction endonuclease subunit S [Myroides sp. DF42-4-2]